jgi:D-glycero-D-manno-heptose 1,7-bisphosphate phosphatase
MKRAVFLDKDGTLIDDVPYTCDPGRIQWLPGVIDGLRRLQFAGYRLLVISNQSGIAHGYFSEADLAAMMSGVGRMLASQGVRLDGSFYCPHHPEGSVPRYAVACACRKPAPGLLMTAAAAHGIDLSRSWMIGDILHDVEAGRRAGCRAILLDNGHETEWRLGAQRWPDGFAGTFDGAAQLILEQDRAASAPIRQGQDERV